MPKLNLIALLAVSVCIGLSAPAALAQSEPPPALAPGETLEPEESPSNKLVWAMAAMVFVNYNCQAPLGHDVYTQTRDLVGQMASSLANDETVGPDFVKASEDIAKTGCPDPNTCWRDYFVLDAQATPADAVPLCKEQMSSIADIIQDLIGTLAQE